MLADTRSDAFRMAVLGAPIGLLVALIIVIMFNQRIARRLRRVEENAVRLQHGEAMVASEDVDDEIGRLGRALYRSGTLTIELQGELHRLASADPLTDLANRRGFMPLLEHQLAIAQATGSSPCQLLFIDLDGLKIVNDHLGHAVGDEMLQETAGPPARYVPHLGRAGEAGRRRVRRVASRGILRWRRGRRSTTHRRRRHGEPAPGTPVRTLDVGRRCDLRPAASAFRRGADRRGRSVDVRAQAHEANRGPRGRNRPRIARQARALDSSPDGPVRTAGTRCAQPTSSGTRPAAATPPSVGSPRRSANSRKRCAPATGRTSSTSSATCSPGCCRSPTSRGSNSRRRSPATRLAVRDAAPSPCGCPAA